MDYRTVNNDENEILDQPFSPFLQFETQEDQQNTDKRIYTEKKQYFIHMID